MIIIIIIIIIRSFCEAKHQMANELKFSDLG